MARFLVTPSLYSDWLWWHRMESKTKEDFLRVLRKQKEDDPEALARMQRGIDFETAIRAAAENLEILAVDDVAPSCIDEIAGVVHGGVWQESVMKDLQLCGLDILLYGKADVIKKDWIFDIKLTSQYDLGKYQDTIQHDTYMACSGIHKFAYLVSDGAEVWREDYFFQPDTAAQLRGKLSDMMTEILAHPEFKAAYLENWQARGEAKQERKTANGF